MGSTPCSGPSPMATGGRCSTCLYVRDGQTLGELAATVPEMTRFGVAKHLAVLQDGGLVVTHRAGRSKLHFLNPVPIRLIHDRWISKYAEPWVSALSRLKSGLESGDVASEEI